MIDGIIAGRLFGAVQSRVSRSGSEYVTAKVRAAAGDGESIFVNVIAFSRTACATLLALSDADSVVLAGTLTPKAWVDKQGDAKPALDMTVQVVTTAYHVARKRKAVSEASSPAAESQSTHEPAMAGDITTTRACAREAAFADDAVDF